jgi:putative transposase
MPRAERIAYEDAYYHVMNRGRGRQKIFHDERYYLAFLKGLDEAHSRFGLEVHAYCLLGNHYHLLVKTPRGNISRCMRHINGLYTQRYNQLQQTDGPLFRGRYKAILVEKDAYLAQLTRYIHRNPIEMRQPLVSNLIDYPWSSYSAYLNKAVCPPWLYREETYSLLGSNHRYAKYGAFVEMDTDEELRTFYEQPRHGGLLGSDEFKAQVYASEENLDLVSKMKKKEAYLPGIAEIVQQVMAATGEESSAIYRGKRGGSNQMARWMAMYLCQVVGGCSLREIADAFGIGHVSGVTHQTRKLKQTVAKDERLGECLKLAIQHLTP